MLIAVVLPAPLGPKKPRTSPVLISRSKESTAILAPKTFASFTARTGVSPGHVAEGLCDIVFMLPA